MMGKREGEVECSERGQRWRAEAKSMLKLLFQRARWGWSHRLGRVPTSCPRPSLRPSPRTQRFTKRDQWWGGEQDRYRGGASRSWTPPLSEPPYTKPGGTRGRAQPQGRGRDCRASGPPPPFPWLGEPPHTARPLARGGAPAFVRTAEHRPLTRAPSWAAAPPYKARPFGPRRGGGGAQP